MGFGLLVAASVIMVWISGALDYERQVIEHAHALLLASDVMRAEQLLAELEHSLIGRFRTRSGREHPVFLMLRGTVKAELGEYNEALRYFSQSIETCAGQRCDVVEAEAYFRKGNVAMLRWQDRAFNQAMYYYEQGLALRPDDPGAKKSLEWLKVFEEEMRAGAKKEKDAGVHRGPNLLQDRTGGPPLSRQRKGY